MGFMPRWFDTHVHLDRYAAAERVGILARAAAAGVDIIAVAVDLESSAKVARQANEIPGAVGIHPKRAVPGFEPQLRTLASNLGIVAIGECGFDSAGPPWEVQEAAFEAQCRLARQLGKALILHVDGSGAWERLAGYADDLDGLRVIRHYFAGDAAQAAWHAARGHYLSFGNPLRRLPELGEIARGYPPELLLIETDTYPLPNRSTEPADVAAIGETVAALRQWTVEECREQLARNTVTAFGPELYG